MTKKYVVMAITNGCFVSEDSIDGMGFAINYADATVFDSVETAVSVAMRAAKCFRGEIICVMVDYGTENAHEWAAYIYKDGRLFQGY